MIKSLGFRQNSYGNVQRIGTTPNDRAVYRVIDSKGQESGKLSIPQNEVDKFESAYRDIMETAPKIQQFTRNNSSEEAIRKRRNLSRAIVFTGGAVGALIPLTITKNLSSTKRVLTTVAGIIAGISGGFVASLSLTAPPGTFKFAKATRTFSKLDIQPVIENRAASE